MRFKPVLITIITNVPIEIFVTKRNLVEKRIKFPYIFNGMF